MAMATLYTRYKSLKGSAEVNPIGVSELSGHEWLLIAIGFVVSFIVAYGCSRGVVYRVGAKARVRAICGLPDHPGSGGAGLGGREDWPLKIGH